MYSTLWASVADIEARGSHIHIGHSSSGNSSNPWLTVGILVVLVVVVVVVAVVKSKRNRTLAARPFLQQAPMPPGSPGMPPQPMAPPPGMLPQPYFGRQSAPPQPYGQQLPPQYGYQANGHPPGVYPSHPPKP